MVRFIFASGKSAYIRLLIEGWGRRFKPDWSLDYRRHHSCIVSISLYPWADVVEQWILTDVRNLVRLAYQVFQTWLKVIHSHFFQSHDRWEALYEIILSAIFGGILAAEQDGPAHNFANIELGWWNLLLKLWLSDDGNVAIFIKRRRSIVCLIGQLNFALQRLKPIF